MDLHSVLNKAVEGDEESFLLLIEQNKDRVYKIAYSYVKNQQDALDIVQETVYKAFMSIHQVKKAHHFNTWLIKIIINCSIDHLRKSKKLVYMAKEFEDRTAELDNTEKFIDLHMALDKLDVKHKTVVILRYFEDLTLQDIANVLEWPVSTVKTYLYRALKILKIDLEEERNG